MLSYKDGRLGPEPLLTLSPPPQKKMPPSAFETLLAASEALKAAHKSPSAATHSLAAASEILSLSCTSLFFDTLPHVSSKQIHNHLISIVCACLLRLFVRVMSLSLIYLSLIASLFCLAFSSHFLYQVSLN